MFCRTSSLVRNTCSIEWLDVSYALKDDAKALGARWAPDAGKWFAPSHLVDSGVLSRFYPTQRQYLICSFGEKDTVKGLGAMWDVEVRKPVKLSFLLALH
jgi:hypothetical protein